MTNTVSTGVLLGEAIHVLMRRWSLTAKAAATALCEVAEELGVDAADLAALVSASEQQRRVVTPVADTTSIPDRSDPGGLVVEMPPWRTLHLVASPGADRGLSRRESEVVALITQGLSNQEIAERTYLSVNSIKGLIRCAYRKMDVQTRPYAILWGIDHGFSPSRSVRTEV